VAAANAAVALCAACQQPAAAMAAAQDCDISCDSSATVLVLAGCCFATPLSGEVV
jgi:hypothetical protein